MTVEMAVFEAQQAILTVLMVSGPMLMTALVVGSGVSVLQAVTQVQEMTLVFVPKIVAVFFVVAVLGGWMLQMIVSYAQNMFISIGQVGP